jgi:hypothetical protein
MTEAGAYCRIIDEGWYPARHEAAAQIARGWAGPVAYVACHVNAGGGSYAMALHDMRSAGGARLARCVVGELERGSLHGLSRFISRETASTGSWRRAHETIKGIFDGPANISAICYEPFFLDTPSHAHMLGGEGIRAVGQALARGILNWGGMETSE